VVFGKATGLANLDLASLSAADGFRLTGVAAGDYGGRSVSAAGDINGDGFDDLIVGAQLTDPNGLSEAGSAYVVFGKASGFGTSFGLSSLDGTNGFRVDGDFDGETIGFSVSRAGDVNDDGFDDVIIGGPEQQGVAYVVFGKATGFADSIDLAALTTSDGFRIDGATPADRLGWSVSDAGDVNGDGIADVIIGAPTSDAGRAYVVFGQATGFGTGLNVSSLDGINGFRLDGETTGFYAGYSVSGAGDVNGDGFADIIVGSPKFSIGSLGEGGASYVVFGKGTAFDATIALGSLDGSNGGFRVVGAAPGNNSGRSVSAAGDVNGDGFADLLIGAPFANSSGATYLLLGKASGFTNIGLYNAVSVDGILINGAAAGDNAGDSVSAAGDLNGDGFADIVIGARRADNNGRTDSGSAHVIFGAGPTTSVIRTGTEAGNKIRGSSDGDTVEAGDGDDRIWLANGDFVVGEESIDGGDGIDTISFTDATTIDFGDDGIPNVERIAGSDFGDVVTMSTPLWTALQRIDLGGGTDTLLLRLSGDITGASRPGVRNVENVGLVGTSGGDMLRLTGRQLDAMLAGSGGIDLGSGDDTIVLTSVSRELNLLGAIDDVLLTDTIAGVNTFDLSEGEGRMTLDLSGQSEQIDVYGSLFNDRIIGGSGRNVLDGWEGVDTLTGGGGQDFFVLAPSGGADKILDFSLVEQDFLQISASAFGFDTLAELDPLPAEAFFAAASPLTTTSESSGGRFLYDTAGGRAGTLYWDADGRGADNAVAIAHLTGAPTLTPSSFLVVD
jgi:hypothetical protein